MSPYHDIPPREGDRPEVNFVQSPFYFPLPSLQFLVDVRCKGGQSIVSKVFFNN